jgi:hypothetical protein
MTAFDVQTLGWLAAALTPATFVCRDMRLLALAANAALIGYGAADRDHGARHRPSRAVSGSERRRSGAAKAAGRRLRATAPVRPRTSQ